MELVALQASITDEDIVTLAIPECAAEIDSGTSAAGGAGHFGYEPLKCFQFTLHDGWTKTIAAGDAVNCWQAVSPVEITAQNGLQVTPETVWTD